MKPLICTHYIDQYLLINRTNRLGARLSSHQYHKLLELCQEDAYDIPEWLFNALEKLGIHKLKSHSLLDIIDSKDVPTLNFGGATYEITETCNYQCVHCYLGDKRRDILNLREKKRLIDIIESAGCLWLRFTGGEPLMDRHFAQIYRYAHEKGLLVTVLTNLSLLNAPNIIQIFSDCPPHRIAASLYGATQASYERLTRKRGSFSSFMSALDIARDTGINLRLNIILTKYNQHEVDAMKSIAINYGFEHHVYSLLIPTIEGNTQPLELQTDFIDSSADRNRPSAPFETNKWTEPCLAGRTFFHVSSWGEVSPCKLTRIHNIDLLREGLSGLSELANIARVMLDTPEACSSCASLRECSTCPPVLSLYQRSGKIPYRICPMKGGDR